MHLCNDAWGDCLARGSYWKVPAWDQWKIEWLLDDSDGSRSVPGHAFLRSVPPNVAKQLLNILDSVRLTGPDAWSDMTMHRPMKGPLRNLHEIRDRHGQRLYRLFVRWLRDERVVVVIDGREKANRTALSDAEYEAVAKLAAGLGRSPRPFARVEDIARTTLDPESQI